MNMDDSSSMQRTKLPLELWKMIFEQIGSGRMAPAWEEKRRHQDALWPLLFVCKAWQSIALQVLYTHPVVESLDHFLAGLNDPSTHRAKAKLELFSFTRSLTIRLTAHRTEYYMILKDLAEPKRPSFLDYHEGPHPLVTLSRECMLPLTPNLERMILVSATLPHSGTNAAPRIESSPITLLYPLFTPRQICLRQILEVGDYMCSNYHDARAGYLPPKIIIHPDGQRLVKYRQSQVCFLAGTVNTIFLDVPFGDVYERSTVLKYWRSSLRAMVMPWRLQRLSDAERIYKATKIRVVLRDATGRIHGDSNDDDGDANGRRMRYRESFINDLKAIVRTALLSEEDRDHQGKGAAKEEFEDIVEFEEAREDAICDVCRLSIFPPIEGCGRRGGQVYRQ